MVLHVACSFSESGGVLRDWRTLCSCQANQFQPSTRAMCTVRKMWVGTAKVVQELVMMLFNESMYDECHGHDADAVVDGAEDGDGDDEDDDDDDMREGSDEGDLALQLAKYKYSACS